MNIEPASQADIPAITAIYGRSVLEEFASFELEPPTEQEMASRMQALLDAGYPYLVAKQAGSVVGYAYCSAFRPRPAYSKTTETTVYVDPNTWGTGVGTALLSGLVDESVKRGMRQMIGIVACEQDSTIDTIPSILLHQKLGFTFTGRLLGVGHKHGKWLDTVILQKAL